MPGIIPPPQNFTGRAMNEPYQITLHRAALKKHEAHWPMGCTIFKPIQQVAHLLKRSEADILLLMRRHNLYLYFGRYVAWEKLEAAMHE